MALKDILVAVDDTPACRVRVELATALAARCEAHLIALHTMPAAEMPRRRDYFDVFGRRLLAPLYREFAERMQAESELAQALFEEIVQRQGVSAEWRTATGYPSQSAALHGRYVDLIVLGQCDPDDAQWAFFRPLPEEVALAVGRPVLVLPYTGGWPQIARHVLVAWDASREATRAVNDALPLLAQAESVTVLSVDPHADWRRHGDVPGADIGLHLARHGVKAVVEETVSAGVGIADVLLSRASDLGADLLVMGAYGHSRVRELVLGGATRTVLDSMTLPVLLAH
ncbi:MAG: universal stress protein [Thiohalocapsa sp.]